MPQYPNSYHSDLHEYRNDLFEVSCDLSDEETLTPEHNPVIPNFSFSICCDILVYNGNILLLTP